MKTLLTTLTALIISLSCAMPPALADAPKVLVMGDSLLASHKISGRAIGHSIGKNLGTKVVDRSIVGARVIYNLPLSGLIGMKISMQYMKDDWDWVVLNGGGNDLWLGCGCAFCKRKMNKMVSLDGSAGVIPKLVKKIRKTGAKVVYLGYLRSPGVGSPIEACKTLGDKFETRIVAMAEQDEGVHFVSLQDLVPHGDRSYHAIDMIHPSLKASREIGAMIADVIKP